MEITEAIGRIKEHIEIHYAKEPRAIYISEALYMGIDALKKQIPKKPIKKNPICYEKTKDGQERYAYEYFCPMCDTKVNKEPHHCPCGQALDWSDTE